MILSDLQQVVELAKSQIASQSYKDKIAKLKSRIKLAHDKNAPEVLTAKRLLDDITKNRQKIIDDFYQQQASAMRNVLRNLVTIEKLTREFNSAIPEPAKAQQAQVAVSFNMLRNVHAIITTFLDVAKYADLPNGALEWIKMLGDSSVAVQSWLDASVAGMTIDDEPPKRKTAVCL